MGWFSGLGGSFVAGVARGLEGGLEKSRELQEEQILRQQGRMETEGLALLRERRKKTQDLTARLDELSTFGITGNTAAAVLRLSPERYQEFIKRADAATRQADRFGAQPSPELEATSASELFDAGVIVEPPITMEDQMGQLGITYTGGIREQQPSREKIIQGIMGAFPSTVTSSKEEFDLQASLNRHLGMADTAGIARNQASKVLGLSANDLDTLITGDYKYTDAPEHVRIKMIQTEAEKLALQNTQLTIREVQQRIIQNQDKIDDIKWANTKIDKDVSIPNFRDPSKPIEYKAGSITNKEYDRELVREELKAKTAERLFNAFGSVVRADYNIIESQVARTLGTRLATIVKDSKYVVTKPNPLTNTYRTTFQGSMDQADVYDWYFKAEANHLQLGETVFIKSQKNHRQTGAALRLYGGHVLNHSGVMWLRDKYKDKTDEEIGKEILDRGEATPILMNTFYSVPVAKYVNNFFTNLSQNKRDEIHDQFLALLKTGDIDTASLEQPSSDVEGRIDQVQKAGRREVDIDAEEKLLGLEGRLSPGTLGQRIEADAAPTTVVRDRDTVDTRSLKQQFGNTRFNQGDTIQNQEKAVSSFFERRGYNTIAINKFFSALKNKAADDGRKKKQAPRNWLGQDFILENFHLLEQSKDAGAVGTTEIPLEDKTGLAARGSEEQALLSTALDRAEGIGRTEEKRRGLVARPTDDQLEEKEQVDEVFDLSYKELDTLVDTVDFTGLNAFDAKQKIREAIRPIVFKMDPDFTNKPFYGAIKDRGYALKTITEELYEHLIYLQQKKLDGVTKTSLLAKPTEQKPKEFTEAELSAADALMVQSSTHFEELYDAGTFERASGKGAKLNKLKRMLKEILRDEKYAAIKNNEAYIDTLVSHFYDRIIDKDAKWEKD